MPIEIKPVTSLAVRQLAWALLLAFSPALHAEDAVRVFAAASLTNVLNDVGEQWRKAGHAAPSLAYGASSALAKQIEVGAPADLFASADLKWMDDLDARGKIAPGTRANLLGNELVLSRGPHHAALLERVRTAGGWVGEV